METSGSNGSTLSGNQHWAEQQPEFIDDDLGYSHGVILFKVSDTIATRSAEAAKRSGLIRVAGIDAGWTASHQGRPFEGLPCKWTASRVDTSKREHVFGDYPGWRRAFDGSTALPLHVFEVRYG